METSQKHKAPPALRYSVSARIDHIVSQRIAETSQMLLKLYKRTVLGIHPLHTRYVLNEHVVWLVVRNESRELKQQWRAFFVWYATMLRKRLTWRTGREQPPAPSWSADVTI